MENQVKNFVITPEIAKDLLSNDTGISRESAGSLKIIDSLADSMLETEWQWIGNPDCLPRAVPNKKYRSIDDPWESTPT